MLNILDLNAMDDAALQQLAEQFSIKRADKLSRQDLIYKILDAQAIQQVAKRAEQRQNGNAAGDNTENEEEPAKRKRGRPRLHPIETAATVAEEAEPAAPRKRGRPRKIREESASTASSFNSSSEERTPAKASEETTRRGDSTLETTTPAITTTPTEGTNAITTETASSLPF